MTIMQNIEVVPKLLKLPADKRRTCAGVEMDPDMGTISSELAATAAEAMAAEPS